MNKEDLHLNLFPLYAYLFSNIICQQQILGNFHLHIGTSSVVEMLEIAPCSTTKAKIKMGVIFSNLAIPAPI
jgi:hypothetical protein